MKRVILFAVTAFAFAIFPSFKIPPATVVDNHLEISVGPEPLINPCNADVLTITGNEVYNTHEVINGNRINVSQHADGDYTATDASGNTYHGSASYEIHQNFSLSNGSVSFNEVYQIHFIGQGSAPNFKETITAHITVNANGTVTVTRVSSDLSCN